jgi:hypothetical protein
MGSPNCEKIRELTAFGSNGFSIKFTAPSSMARALLGGRDAIPLAEDFGFSHFAMVAH